MISLTTPLARHRQNRDRLAVHFKGEPVQGLFGAGEKGARQHYHLLNGNMDASLIQDVVGLLVMFDGVSAIDEVAVAPAWLKPYWMPHVVK